MISASIFDYYVITQDNRGYDKPDESKKDHSA